MRTLTLCVLNVELKGIAPKHVDERRGAAIARLTATVMPPADVEINRMEQETSQMRAAADLQRKQRISLQDQRRKPGDWTAASTTSRMKV